MLLDFTHMRREVAVFQRVLILTLKVVPQKLVEATPILEVLALLLSICMKRRLENTMSKNLLQARQ